MYHLHFSERVGFEPTVPYKEQRFSRPPDSTTLAPLHYSCEIITIIYRKMTFPSLYTHVVKKALLTEKME